VRWTAARSTVRRKRRCTACSPSTRRFAPGCGVPDRGASWSWAGSSGRRRSRSRTRQRARER
jgi:hypothetical protein